VEVRAVAFRLCRLSGSQMDVKRRWSHGAQSKLDAFSFERIPDFRHLPIRVEAREFERFLEDTFSTLANPLVEVSNVLHMH